MFKEKEVVVKSITEAAGGHNAIAKSTISEYQTGKTVYKFIEGIGWILVIIGALAAFVLMVQLSSMHRATFAIVMAGMFPGLGIAFGGLLSIAMAQVMRATIATAENSQRILEQMSKQD